MLLSRVWSAYKKLIGSGDPSEMAHHIAFVLGQFHQQQAGEMLQEGEQAANEMGMTVASRVWVPGSMEIPLAVKKLLVQGKVDGIVVLGTIERGETKHGVVMGNAVTNALIQLQLEFMKPIGMGILGPEIYPSQIAARLRPYARSATIAVSHMLTAATS
jgi:6,7-dimethyl-8-ribityllumazine synthase